jgi:serine protease Do
VEEFTNEKVDTAPVQTNTAVILEPGNTSFPPDVTQKENPKEHKTSKKTWSTGKVIAICLVFSIVSSLLSAGLFALYNNPGKPKNDIYATPIEHNRETDDNKPVDNVTINVENVSSPATAVAKKVTPSIAGIRVTTITNYGPYGNYESSGDGSGVIYTQDGYIITNYHVIKEMVTSSGEKNPNSTLTVYLNQDASEKYEGVVVGYDQGADLAVIKISASGLTAIEIGDSDAINVGDIAIAIGNPGGLDFMGSTSQGIISGLNRSVQTEGSYEDLSLIQTDAAINPGNSGGALCDINGKLIGINSVKLVETGYESMGFAIPSNNVVKICDNIIKSGNSSSVYLGLEFNEKFTAEILEKQGYPGGIVVSSIAHDSPAEKAGFETDDILVSFNGKDIKSTQDLIAAKKQCQAGETVYAKVYRLTLERYGFTQKWVGSYIDLSITLE